MRHGGQLQLVEAERAAWDDAPPDPLDWMTDAEEAQLREVSANEAAEFGYPLKGLRRGRR